MTSYDLHRRTTDEPTPAPTQISEKLAALLPDQPARQTLEATAPQPTLRIRVEHSRTIKDGWSYSTTVELDGIEAGKESRSLDLIEFVLGEVRKLGEDERDIRNGRDALLKEATARISDT